MHAQSVTDFLCFTREKNFQRIFFSWTSTRRCFKNVHCLNVSRVLVITKSIYQCIIIFSHNIFQKNLLVGFKKYFLISNGIFISELTYEINTFLINTMDIAYISVYLPCLCFKIFLYWWRNFYYAPLMFWWLNLMLYFLELLKRMKRPYLNQLAKMR